MVVLESFPDQGARNTEREDLMVQPRRPHVGEPHDDRRLRELRPGAGEHVRPRVTGRLLRVGVRHTYSTEPFHTGGQRKREGCPSIGHDIAVPRGEGGRDLSTGIFPPHTRRAILTLFLLSSPLSSVDVASYTPAIVGERRLFVEQGRSLPWPRASAPTSRTLATGRRFTGFAIACALGLDAP